EYHEAVPPVAKLVQCNPGSIIEFIVDLQRSPHEPARWSLGPHPKAPTLFRRQVHRSASRTIQAHLEARSHHCQTRSIDVGPLRRVRVFLSEALLITQRHEGRNFITQRVPVVNGGDCYGGGTTELDQERRTNGLVCTANHHSVSIFILCDDAELTFHEELLSGAMIPLQEQASCCARMHHSVSR